MELRHLRYFLAVAEEKSFSRAAERLHVSQPPLSMHVKALEGELGVRLLDRTNRGVTLTPAGQVFLDEIRAVLRRLDQARIKAQHAGQGEVGTLSVGFVSTAGYGILPPALKQFRERFPGVDVQLHELTTDAQIREMRAGRLDLGIGLGPVDEVDLVFETVLRETLVLAAPVRHASLPRSGPVRLKALSNEHFIIPPRDVGPGLYDLIISLCRGAGFTPRITQHARQMQTVIGLVASGMGIALVPASVQNLKRAGVQYRALKGATGSVELGLLRARDDEAQIANRFVEVLKDAAAAHG
ncbi:MAG: LysR family transcriptional regulator [Steroidobacteraceae bacterium]|nr:LysR family transcriptional regulator [Steroidobacteraceae bacterium]